ncbi:MAG: hypothetical protein KJ726_04365 [Verrucomicrobia bacterium]|nr:hypothetical protein [Verrucomicrobiota bacterium]MBU1909262.1 hypothetical protein [Verrucomicrobiota bacterium]
MKLSYFILAAVLATGLVLVGCEDDNSPDTGTTSESGATSERDTTSDAEEPADVGGTTDEPAEAQPEEAPSFEDITPGGLGGEFFRIAGRGQYFRCWCSPIEGAVTYVFTTTLGSYDEVNSPEVSVPVEAGTMLVYVEFHVYAINTEGNSTRTATARVDF